MYRSKSLALCCESNHDSNSFYFRSNKGKALFKKQQENSTSSAPRSPLSKVASESDLTQSLNLPQVNGRENGAVVGDVEPISITVNATFAKQKFEEGSTRGEPIPQKQELRTLIPLQKSIHLLISNP